MLSSGASTDVSVSLPAGTSPLRAGEKVARGGLASPRMSGAPGPPIDPLTASTTARVILHLLPPASPLSCCKGKAAFDTVTGFSLIFNVHASAEAGVRNLGLLCRVRI